MYVSIIEAMLFDVLIEACWISSIATSLDKTLAKKMRYHLPKYLT